MSHIGATTTAGGTAGTSTSNHEQAAKEATATAKSQVRCYYAIPLFDLSLVGGEYCIRRTAASAAQKIEIYWMMMNTQKT